jgi:subtilisin family serine protease
MSFVRRVWWAAVVVVVAAAIGVPVEPAGPVRAASAAAVEQDQGPPDVLPPREQWTVTLLTGETVGVATDAEGRVAVEVRNADGPVRVLREPDGEVYVLPAGFGPELDPELFNVTGLIRQRYDDDSGDALPVIVQHAPAAAGGAAQTAGVAPPRSLPSIDAVAVEVPKGDPAVATALLDGVEDAAIAGARRGAAPRVWLDRRIEAPERVVGADRAPRSGRSPGAGGRLVAAELDRNLRQIGADRAWEAGYTGEGAKVAVLDTGIDATHPDLAGQVVAQQNFSGSPDIVDRYGHGTHVAAIAAGSGAGAPGARSGVAPAADLVIGKVLGDDGSGPLSEIIAGMEWAAPQVDVVNMSLGSGFPSDGSDPFSQALDQLSDRHDTLFVTSAGNGGPASQTVGDPAAADRALAVGAVDVDDRLAEFSSRGPLIGSYEMKPEIVAPGVDVVAARAANTLMGDPVDAGYTSASGTSMAAPHVAGAAALLVEQHPDWAAPQLESALVGSADGLDADGFDVGAGRLDIGAGVASPLRAEHDVVDLVLPHPRTAPAPHTLTWTNHGDEPVTVDLAAELEDRQGGASAAAAVSPEQLTVAPGATGTAELRVDAPALADGLWSGAVVATVDGGHEGAGAGAGTTTVRTPIGIHAEPRLVDLTIEVDAPPGGMPAPSPFVFYTVTNLDDYATFNAWDALNASSVTLQVPVGRYSVVGVAGNSDLDNRLDALVGDPDVVVDGPTTVAFAGAAAEPFDPRLRGVATDRALYAETSLLSTPARGAGGGAVLVAAVTQYPMAATRLVPMEGDPEVFEAQHVFRLQAPPLTVAVGGGGPLAEVVVPNGVTAPSPGEATLTAVDAGDGSSLAGTEGHLAVVRLPAFGDRDVVTQRAHEAGTALLAFVDEARSQLDPTWFEELADVPIISAGGASATALIEAGGAGAPVTVTYRGSPFAYDLVRTGLHEVDPTPVIRRAERRQLARIDERFHRDADGTGVTFDSRGPASVETHGYLASVGPLPERRTSYVTPDVVWESAAEGPYLGEFFRDFPPITLVGQLSRDGGARYEARSRQRLTWLRRPQWPGLVADVVSDPFCPALPSLRTSDTLFVHVVPFQDRFGRTTCGDALDETLTVRRNGVVVGSEEHNSGVFPVAPGTADFAVSYEQDGQAPYVHHSTTRWTFRSGDPSDGDDLLPLVTVGYRLPLDTTNRLTGGTATFTVRNIASSRTGARSLKVWTSTDAGATWEPAPVRRTTARKFAVTLPEVAPGTAVSLKADARDRRGNRIEQALIDAYTA